MGAIFLTTVFNSRQNLVGCQNNRRRKQKEIKMLPTLTSIIYLIAVIYLIIGTGLMSIMFYENISGDLDGELALKMGVGMILWGPIIMVCAIGMIPQIIIIIYDKFKRLFSVNRGE
jgi:hypothetical protein